MVFIHSDLFESGEELRENATNEVNLQWLRAGLGDRSFFRTPVFDRTFGAVRRDQRWITRGIPAARLAVDFFEAFSLPIPLPARRPFPVFVGFRSISESLLELVRVVGAFHWISRHLKKDR
jgi:hypothetical protein